MRGRGEVPGRIRGEIGRGGTRRLGREDTRQRRRALGMI